MCACMWCVVCVFACVVMFCSHFGLRLNRHEGPRLRCAGPCAQRSMKSSRNSTRRKAVEIEKSEAWKVFDQIPLANITATKPLYKFFNFKNAPKWKGAVKLVPAISKMLDYSNGFNVHQKCLQKHLKTWDVENETDMDEDTRDGVVMSIRSLVSQMQNHRRKDRSVPKTWQSKFQTVFDKVQYNQLLR